MTYDQQILRYMPRTHYDKRVRDGMAHAIRRYVLYSNTPLYYADTYGETFVNYDYLQGFIMEAHREAHDIWSNSRKSGIIGRMMTPEDRAKAVACIACKESTGLGLRVIIEYELWAIEQEGGTWMIWD